MPARWQIDNNVAFSNFANVTDLDGSCAVQHLIVRCYIKYVLQRTK